MRYKRTCKKCGTAVVFSDEDEFIVCPECGRKVKNPHYQEWEDEEDDYEDNYNLDNSNYLEEAPQIDERRQLWEAQQQIKRETKIYKRKRRVWKAISIIGLIIGIVGFLVEPISEAMGIKLEGGSDLVIAGLIVLVVPLVILFLTRKPICRQCGNIMLLQDREDRGRIGTKTYYNYDKDGRRTSANTYNVHEVKDTYKCIVCGLVDHSIYNVENR